LPRKKKQKKTQQNRYGTTDAKRPAAFHGRMSPAAGCGPRLARLGSASWPLKRKKKNLNKRKPRAGALNQKEKAAKSYPTKTIKLILSYRDNGKKT